MTNSTTFVNGTVVMPTWCNDVNTATYRTVLAEHYGAVGDGVTDDTAALQTAFAAAGGSILMLAKNKTYLVTDELPMEDYCTLLGQGSVINFQPIGGKKCLRVRTGCTVDMQGGTVQNTSSDTTNYEGTLQTPIVVGEYTNTTGEYGWTVRNTKIINTRNATTVGMSIFADSSNGLVENIDLGDNTTMSVGLQCHWSFDGGNTVPAYLGITTHPNNIKFRNIKAGTWSGTFTSLIFLSAAYNIEVSNLSCKSMSSGFGVSIYAGDWGFQFGTALEQELGLTGYYIDNVNGKFMSPVHIYGRNPDQAVVKNWPCSIELSRINAMGYDNTNAACRGIQIDNCSNGLTIKQSYLSTFYNGMYLGGIVDTVKVDHCSVFNSYQSGFNGNAVTGAANIQVFDSHFFNSNTSSASNKADIHLTTVDGFILSGNRLNSSTATWNIRVESGNSGRVVNNRSVNVSATGPAFSYGSSSDNTIIDIDNGNTSDTNPSNGIRSGSKFLPVIRTAAEGTTDKVRICWGAAMPTTGTWGKGSVVWNSAPTVGQPIGWMRITTGSGNVLNTDWVALANL